MKLSRLEGALCVIVAAALALPVGVLGGSPAASGANAEKDWTIMMYWDGDNSLEFTTGFCLSIWEQTLTSNDNVNIVAFVDIASMNGAWVYEIADGKNKTVATWPEQNSSDPMVLEKFILFAMDNYPAKKNMLVIQDHGYGWRGICQDETNGDTLMPIQGIAQALKDVRSIEGKPVDIVSCDACNMATMEVVYELRDSAPYFLASQSTVPFDGFPYRMFISDLVKNPSMTPKDLAIDIVHEFVLYYSDKWAYEHIYRYTQEFATISAWDLSKTGALGDAFSQMTSVLEPFIPTHKKIVEGARGYALQGTWTNMAGYEWMPDAYALFDGLRGKIDPSLDSAIVAWENAFSSALIAEEHSKKFSDRSTHGLNIWFPPSLSQYNSQGWAWARQFTYTNIGLDIVSSSAWADCLMAYYNAK